MRARHNDNINKWTVELHRYAGHYMANNYSITIALFAQVWGVTKATARNRVKQLERAKVIEINLKSGNTSYYKAGAEYWLELGNDG
jgi:predicted transcriptional regulator